MAKRETHRDRVLRHMARQTLLHQLRESVRQIELAERPNPSRGARQERADSRNSYVQQRSLHRAFDQRGPILSLPIRVRLDGATYPVQVQGNPLHEAGEWRRAVILFINGETLDETSSPEQQIS
jgi:hypothetical protein